MISSTAPKYIWISLSANTNEKYDIIFVVETKLVNKFIEHIDQMLFSYEEDIHER